MSGRGDRIPSSPLLRCACPATLTAERAHAALLAPGDAVICPRCRRTWPLAEANYIAAVSVALAIATAGHYLVDDPEPLLARAELARLTGGTA